MKCHAPDCANEATVSFALFSGRQLLREHATCYAHGGQLSAFLHADWWRDTEAAESVGGARGCRLLCLAVDMTRWWGAMYLRERGGTRTLCVRCEPFVVLNLRRALECESPARPSTHEMMVALLVALKARLDHVFLGEPSGKYLRATLCIRVREREVVVDTRPSDAIHLATLTDSTVYVADQLLAEGTPQRWTGPAGSPERTDNALTLCAAEGCERSATGEVLVIDPDNCTRSFDLCANHCEELLADWSSQGRASSESSESQQHLIQAALGLCAIDYSSRAAWLGLCELSGSRKISIRTGVFEGNLLDSELRHPGSLPPSTHASIVAVISALGARLDAVIIDKVTPESGIFHAKLRISQHNTSIVIDARPSDALTLATIEAAPILIAAEVVKTAAK